MDRRRQPRPQRVLVVDDNRDIRELWALWLSMWGFEVEQASNGAEGVKTARRDRPQLILMDVWMPVLDGLAATAELRSDGALADVPVLCVSAQTVPPAEEEAIEAGCTEFVPKPVDPDELLERIRRALRQPSRHSA